MNNKTIIGNVGSIKNEERFTKFSVATSDGYGEHKQTNWHNCICFGKTKELVDRFIEKGKKIYVSGVDNSKTYNEKLTWTITVEKFEMLSPREQHNNNQNNNYQNNNYEDNEPSF